MTQRRNKKIQRIEKKVNTTKEKNRNSMIDSRSRREKRVGEPGICSFFIRISELSIHRFDSKSVSNNELLIDFVIIITFAFKKLFPKLPVRCISKRDHNICKIRSIYMQSKTPTPKLIITFWCLPSICQKRWLIIIAIYLTYFSYRFSLFKDISILFLYNII